MNLLKEGLNLQGQQVGCSAFDTLAAEAKAKGFPHAKKLLLEKDCDLIVEGADIEERLRRGLHYLISVVEEGTYSEIQMALHSAKRLTKLKSLRFPAPVEAHGRIDKPFSGNREEPSEPGGAVVEKIEVRAGEELNEYFEGLINGE